MLVAWISLLFQKLCQHNGLKPRTDAHIVVCLHNRYEADVSQLYMFIPTFSCIPRPFFKEEGESGEYSTSSHLAAMDSAKGLVSL